MRIVDDGHQHFAAAIEIEGLLDQLPLALERRTFELDAKRFAEYLYCIGIGVQRSRDGRYQIILSSL